MTKNSNERTRAEVLAALDAVDVVIIFEDDTPIDFISNILPCTLINGSDYTCDQVVGHEIVAPERGDVFQINIYQGHSTMPLAGRALGEESLAKTEIFWTTMQ